MRLLKLAAFALVTAGPLGAQSVPATLSLEDAISLARKNNPTYLQALNTQHRAGNAVRNAYGAFLPSANTSFGAGYRQGKPQNFAGVSIGSNSDLLSSSWSLGFSMGISANTFANLRRSQQNEEAADADTRAAEQNLVSAVTQQYLLVLQTEARATLQDSLVVSNQLQLDLARAKAGVGSATSLDVMRAEVAVGQQRVAALRARNLADVAILQLFQQIGVPKPDSVTLTSNFQVSEPTMTVKSLLDMAEQSNPTLASLRRREDAAHTSYRAAQGAYLPSVSASASFGGFAQKYKDPNYLVNQAAGQAAASRANCFTTDSLRVGAGMSSIAAQCSAIQFTDAQADALRASNDAFPFRFTSNPYNLSLGISLPLFDGFSRETQVQNASADRMDASYRVRDEQLVLTASVTSAWTTLVANYRAFRLQEQNAAAARTALQLAQERYRVGLNSLVDLQQARSDYATAETDRIDALYEFHRSFAALENAVGRPLR
ncbi:MAG TPA: TolC family protein [Gemmatimonadaceae bacterium]|nr:TolC family protein [Gemmatimonadaceae bacterium]